MMIEEEVSAYIAFSTKKQGYAMTYEALRLMTHKAAEFVAAEDRNPPHWFRLAYITKNSWPTAIHCSMLCNKSAMIR